MDSWDLLVLHGSPCGTACQIASGRTGLEPLEQGQETGCRVYVAIWTGSRDICSVLGTQCSDITSHHSRMMQWHSAVTSAKQLDVWFPALSDSLDTGPKASSKEWVYQGHFFVVIHRNNYGLPITNHWAKAIKQAKIGSTFLMAHLPKDRFKYSALIIR